MVEPIEVARGFVEFLNSPPMQLYAGTVSQSIANYLSFPLEIQATIAAIGVGVGALVDLQLIKRKILIEARKIKGKIPSKPEEVGFDKRDERGDSPISTRPGTKRGTPIRLNPVDPYKTETLPNGNIVQSWTTYKLGPGGIRIPIFHRQVLDPNGKQIRYTTSGKTFLVI